MSEIIAFFDIDDTLLDGASGNMVVKHMIKTGKMKRRAVLKALKFNVLYRLNRLPRQEIYRWVFEECSRFTIEELLKITDEAYELYIHQKLFAEGVEAVEKHKSLGHRTVIATAATEYISELIRVQMGADDRIAVTVKVKNGYCTEEYEAPLPYGEGKLVRAKEYAQSRGSSLESCYFYSDSISDLPLLESVGYPIVVNPQRKLLKLAVERGWKVENWRRHLEGSKKAKAEALTFADELMSSEYREIGGIELLG